MKKHDILQKLIIMGFLVFLIFVSFIFYMRDAHKSEQLTQAEELRRIQDIRFYGEFWRYAAVVGSISLVVTILITGVCIGKAHIMKASVYILKIANSEVPISIKEIRHGVSEYALGLINAEQLEKRNAGTEKALQLYEALANSEMKRLSALSKFVPSQGGFLSPYPLDGEERQIAPHIPSFSELLDSGEVGSQKPLILGYTDSGQPDYSTWESLYSIAEGGTSGSGKTTSIRHIIASSLLSGQVGTFDIIDLAYPREQSLLQSIGNLREHSRIRWFDNTSAFGDIQTALKRHYQYIYRLFEERAHIPFNEKIPYVLVIDEVFRVGYLCPETYALLHKINTEGRKDKIFEIASSHSWKGEQVGGTEIRDLSETRIVHRMKPKQARMLLDGYDKTIVNRVQHFHDGQALVVPRGQAPRELTIPYNTIQDMNRVATMIEGNTVKRLDVQSEPDYIQIKNTLLEKYHSQKAIAQVAEVGEVDVCRYFKNGMGKSEKIQKIKELI